MKPYHNMTWRDKGILACRLFFFFFRIGWFTFGGGWNIVAQIQKEFSEKRHWISDEELLDLTAVGRSLPGTMIGNVSYLFGHHLGGTLCGVASTLGMLVPPVMILSIVTMFYHSFRDNIYVSRAMVGVRASVVPIIGHACLKMAKSAYRDRIGYLITILALVLWLFFHANSILLVIIGALVGIVILGRRPEEESPSSSPEKSGKERS